MVPTRFKRGRDDAGRTNTNHQQRWPSQQNGPRINPWMTNEPAKPALLPTPPLMPDLGKINPGILGRLAQMPQMNMANLGNLVLAPGFSPKDLETLAQHLLFQNQAQLQNVPAPLQNNSTWMPNQNELINQRENFHQNHYKQPNQWKNNPNQPNHQRNNNQNLSNQQRNKNQNQSNHQRNNNQNQPYHQRNFNQNQANHQRNFNHTQANNERIKSNVHWTRAVNGRAVTRAALENKQLETREQSEFHERCGVNGSSSRSDSNISTEAQNNLTEMDQSWRTDAGEYDGEDELQNGTGPVVSSKRQRNVGKRRRRIRKKDQDFGGVLTDMVMCHICDRYFGGSREFKDHINGKPHREEVRLREQRYIREVNEMRTKIRDIEMQKQRSMESRGQTTVSACMRCCLVCDLKYVGDVATHEIEEYHQKLKPFYKPSCKDCNQSFMTRILYDTHLCSVEHIQTAGRADYEREQKMKKPAARKADRMATEGGEMRIKIKEESGDSVGAVSNGKEEQVEKTAKDEQAKHNEMKESRKEYKSTIGTVKPPSNVEMANASQQSIKDLQDTVDCRKREPVTITPQYDPKVPFGMDAIVPKTGYMCITCNLFLPSSHAVDVHTTSKHHYEKHVLRLSKGQRKSLAENSRKTTELKKCAETSKLEKSKIKLEHSTSENSNSKLMNTKSGLENPMSKLNNSTSKLNNSTSKLDNSTSKLNNSTSKLDNSTSKLDNSTSKLNNSTSKLDNSTSKLENSTSKLENSTSKHENSRKANISFGKRSNLNEDFDLWMEQRPVSTTRKRHEISDLDNDADASDDDGNWKRQRRSFEQNEDINESGDWRSRGVREKARSNASKDTFSKEVAREDNITEETQSEDALWNSPTAQDLDDLFNAMGEDEDILNAR